MTASVVSSFNSWRPWSSSSSSDTAPASASGSVLVAAEAEFAVLSMSGFFFPAAITQMTWCRRSSERSRTTSSRRMLAHDGRATAQSTSVAPVNAFVYTERRRRMEARGARSVNVVNASRTESPSRVSEK
eukprot:Amastigsp_a679637_29.p3 type:complete len:130 gc:universal Amastigsp_a679637_29:859-1248(+)